MALWSLKVCQADASPLQYILRFPPPPGLTGPTADTTPATHPLHLKYTTPYFQLLGLPQ